MTNEKAYDVLINKIQIDVKYTDDFNRDYECLMMCANALEKQIPKKPLEDRKYYGVGKCPVCGVVFFSKNLITPYCGNCGQAIDWSDSE